MKQDKINPDTTMNNQFNFNKRKPFFMLVIMFLVLGISNVSADSKDNQNQNNLYVSTFDVDATPPLGTYLAYKEAVHDYDLKLRARGIVVLGAGQPIVLCAVDWIGIGNEGHDAFCNALAKAAGTTPERVAVQTLHQHDTPWCDFSAEKILKDAGFEPTKYDDSFARIVINRLAVAIKDSVKHPAPISHIGYGEATVYKVASNRRILGPDGQVAGERLSHCEDSTLRAAPEGLIDPIVSEVSFWNGEKPVAVLSYYACHPQSYYRTGIPNPDFVGIARFMRQLAVPEALHVHFDGAGGNIAAGKYNDGSKINRGILANRLADGMKRAWESTRKVPITAQQVKWAIEPVALPPAQYLYTLQDEPGWEPDSLLVRCYPARIAWFHRCQEGKKINIGCLSIDKIRILHLPGEPFVEFQLAAKAERKDLHVVVAGYGDYGPGYIGTSSAYTQGGYETSHVSNVSADAEPLLMKAIRKLLR